MNKSNSSASLKYEAVDPDKDVEDEISDLRPTRLLKKENIAIAMSYFSVGFVSSFISTPLNIYMVNVLNAEPPMQNTIGILMTLPWSLKLLFGFLSDAVPICGMHRKPYLTMGAMLYSMAYFLYGYFEMDNIVLMAACIFLGTLGLIALDVMADTMCVERSRFESEKHRGQMQASCYSIRFGGGLVGALLGASVCNQEVWGWGLTFHQVALLNGCIPFLFVTPWLYVLKEKYHKTIHRIASASRMNLDIEMTYTDNNHHQNNSNNAHSGTIVKPHLGLTEANLKNTETSRLLSKSENAKDKATPVKYQTFNLTPKLNKMMSSNSEGFADSPIGSVKDSDGFFESSSDSKPSSKPSSKPNSKQNSRINSFKGEGGKFDDIPSNINEEVFEGLYEVMYEDVISLKADDDDRHETHPVLLQLYEIWDTVQLQAVWRPMAFVYIFNLMQIPNVAWQSYLQLSLGFPAWVLGLTVTLGSFMTFAGILAYKYLFFSASWRSIYMYTSCLTAFFSFLQIILIFQINTKYLHLSNYLFSMGDDVISAYINGIQFLPVCVMYMRLCPEGSEGASYAMLTTFSNIGMICASNLGNMLSNIWDVSNEAMRHNDVSGLWKLSVLTSTLALMPLSLLWLLPSNPEEQENLAKSKVKSKLGGIVFLSVLFGSLIWSISTALMRLIECQYMMANE